MYKLAVIGGGITGLWAGFMGGDNTIVLEKEKTIGKNSLSSLWSIMPPLCGDAEEECIEAEKDYEDICSNLGIFCKKTHILKLDSFTGKGRQIEKNEIRTFEPQITAEHAELFENGMFVEGNEFFTRMEDSLNIDKGVLVTKINSEGGLITSLETNKGEIKAEKYIFATGYLTKELINLDVSLLKGHLIKTRRIGLNGIVIYKGRIAVEGRELYLNGDSTRTNDGSVNYDIINETVSILSNILRIDMQNFSVSTGFRTVSSDGKPLVKKIFENGVVITGFKFGFALAPILARQGIKLLNIR